MNMTIRMGLVSLASIIAVGAALTATAFAQDDLTGQRPLRGFGQERSHTINPYAADIYQQRVQSVHQCSDSPARC
jgi:hypothetical protein